MRIRRRVLTLITAAAVVGSVGLAGAHANAAPAPGGGLSTADVTHVQGIGHGLTTNKAGKHVKAVKVNGGKVFDQLFPGVTIGGPGGSDDTARLRAADLVVVQSTGADLPTGINEGQAYGAPADANTVITTVMDANGWVIAVIGATAATPADANEKKDLAKTFGPDTADIVVKA